MVHDKHKHHIILWEREDGDAYIHVDPALLTPEFIEKIKADKDDEMGWKKYHKKLKEKGYPIE